MPTLKEVALRAEVSTATVSKVLSNTPYVSDETRSRVLKAVEELGYVPNLAARALSKGRTYIIGVIFPYRYDQMFGDPHMLTILEGIETVCAQRDYSMLLSTPKIPVTESEQYQRLIRSGYLDGVIAMETVASSPVSNVI
jgi:DNA-binding LacI/PurR family transcriptional regulator